MPPIEEQKVLKYWTLIEHLREQVTQANLRPGDRAPSFSEMQAQFGVSRATVEKAYTLLEQEGFLVREQGRGTFVSSVTPAAHRSQNGVFGLLMATRNSSHPYMLPLLNGIREAAEELDLELLWMNRPETASWDKVDGVLVYLSAFETELYQIPESLPRISILVGMEGMSSVTADDFNGAKQATEHLIRQGHRRIAHLVSSRHDHFSKQRLAGYESALREAGIEPEPQWVRTLPPDRGLAYLPKGERAMEMWLREDWRHVGCTALLAANDETAIGAIKALNKAGLSVPGDVSAVGFDGTELSDVCTPPLTTVRVPLQAIGRRVVQMLRDHMNLPVPPVENIVLPVEMKWGESTAPRL